MKIQRFIWDARAVVFCVGSRLRTDKDDSAALQGALRPLLNEYFFHQAPLLVLYHYDASPEALTPAELGAQLAIEEIGTDNAFRKLLSQTHLKYLLIMFFCSDIHTWKTNLIAELQPGLDWLAAALDEYFAKVPKNFRLLLRHPDVIAARKKHGHQVPDDENEQLSDDDAEYPPGSDRCIVS